MNAAIAQQAAAAAAANSAAMASVAGNIKASIQAQCPTATLLQNADGTWSCPSLLSSVPMWVWLAGGGLMAVLVLKGRRN